MVKADHIISLAEIISYMPGNVYWTDVNGVYQGCNANVVKVLKLNSVQDVIGKKIHALIGDQKIADEVERIDSEVMRGDKEVVTEQEAFDANGQWAVYFTRKQPLHDSAGRVIGVLGISLDITERKLAEKVIVEAKNAAESANRAKTEFLANMSHDIKTPMTGVVSVADLMMHVPAWCTPEKAEIIYSSGQQVLNFFNSCLELSKLEMSEFSSAEVAFSLKSVFEEIYALFLPRAQSKNLKFRLDYDVALPQILLGHRSSVYRVILNLIGNALKFTETGEVHLRAFLAESLSENTIRVGIEVKDTGIGIPADKQEIIFEKLRRLTPSYEGKMEGSGIGLYIVDQYIKRMNGSINVESVVDQGSTFTVLLPMTVASPLFSSDNQKEQTHILDAYTQVKASTASTAELKQAKTLTANAPLFLLVEDNPIVQLVTNALLNDAGFRVDIASSGEEAVDMFSPGKYDLIYMDIGLPKMNGYEATQAIRAKENATKKVPIIALTSHGAVDVQAFCGQVGMQGVLSKPLMREQAENVWKRYGKGESIYVEGLIFIND